jgi:hypothetical protein
MSYFYDTRYSDEQAETIVELWGEIEAELIKEIAYFVKRAIEKGEDLSYTGEFRAWQLQEANLLNDRAVALISKATGESEKAVRQCIENTGLYVAKGDEKLFRQALESGQLTVDPLPLDQSPRLKAAIDACVENAEFGLSNLTNTRMDYGFNGWESLTHATNREYYNATNAGFLAMRTGEKSLDQAVYSSCRSLIDKGISMVHWESGHTDSIEVAVRRNIRTSIAQTSGKMTLARMEDYQYDLVETSSHFGARPEHAEWQGQIFSLTGSNGYENFYDVCEYGDILGICGINCRHRFFPYFPGTTPSFEQYDEEKNREMYEKTQTQRAYERAIRKAKRELAVAEGAGLDTKEAKAKVREKQKAIRDWLAQPENSDLTRRYENERIY